MAEPEADPAYVYANGVYGYNPAVVPTVFNRPLIYSGVPVVVKAQEKQDAPETETAPEAAETKPEEKVIVPATYTIPYTTQVATPYVASPYVTPYVVAAPKYYAHSAGVVHAVNKREADATADPAYYYNAYGYGYPSFYARPYAYNYGFRPYGYYY